ncbi:MAG: hypothetical protein II965_00825 [Pyramidobacter sp.]|nr:hypothetical protein [Pyramidobacter sp.]
MAVAKNEYSPAELDAALAEMPAVAVNVGEAEERIEQIENEQAAADNSEAPVPDQQEAPAVPDVETSFALRRTVEHKGEIYERVELDRDKLTGEAVTRAERMFMIECPGAPIGAMQTSLTFYMILGSIAAGIPYAVVKKMDGFDSARLGNAALALFFGR